MGSCEDIYFIIAYFFVLTSKVCRDCCMAEDMLLCPCYYECLNIPCNNPHRADDGLHVRLLLKDNKPCKYVLTKKQHCVKRITENYHSEQTKVFYLHTLS